jgi:small subunit ribosomal protein S1
MTQSFSSPDDSDFAALLEQSFEEMEDAKRGDILTGMILAIDNHGIIVDVGLKRDGVVPRSDVDALDDPDQYQVGQEVTVMVVKAEDYDGNLVVSIQQALASKDWDAAITHMDSGDLYPGKVVAANKGGLIVPFGELRGFVPASHVLDLPRGLGDDERATFLSKLVGKRLDLKIIEVNPERRRLVLSQREAERDARDNAKERLLDRLKVGDVVKGMVSSLREFGAFIDLGGADGLVHISELAWRRVRHPGEILNIGQEVETYVLQLDREEKRIGLSLKRLQPNPWEEIEKNYSIGQEVEGNVSRVVSFGAFVELDNGIEALLHVSQMGDPAPQAPEELVRPGERITAKIVSLEPERQRMGLTLKPVGEHGEPIVSTEVELDTPEVELDTPEAELDTVEVNG